MTTRENSFIIVTAQNMASANTTRPLIEAFGPRISAVVILDNFPLTSWKEFKAFVKLIRRCGWSFLWFKFVEIWVHYAISLARRESVAQLCRRRGVNTLHFASARSDALARAIAEIAPDYIVSTGPAILSKSLIESAKIATLNCHGADLPSYRGPANYVWTRLNGDEARTITIHRMAPKIDAGAIWRKKTLPLDKRWSVYEYNFRHTLDAGRFLSQSMQEILAGGPDAETEQDESQAVVRTFPTESDMRRLKNAGVVLMRPCDAFRCVGEGDLGAREAT